MIVRAGHPVAFPILFPNGRPDGQVAYKVYDPAGIIATGNIAVPAGAVSVVLLVDASKNQLASGSMLSYRDVEWSYAVNGLFQGGEVRYTLEARVPFGVSADGVRTKLGVDKTDLPDGDVSLVKAYIAFRQVVTAAALATRTADDVAVIDAIEALAALSLIPTMAVRVATKESSGTNQFQRQAIDWTEVAESLSAVVDAGYLAVVPTYSQTSSFGPLLIVVRPATDAITGEAV